MAYLEILLKNFFRKFIQFAIRLEIAFYKPKKGRPIKITMT
jgi:hypothetical protein